MKTYSCEGWWVLLTQEGGLRRRLDLVGFVVDHITHLERILDSLEEQNRPSARSVELLSMFCWPLRSVENAVHRVVSSFAILKVTPVIRHHARDCSLLVDPDHLYWE